MPASNQATQTGLGLLRFTDAPLQTGGQTLHRQTVTSRFAATLALLWWSGPNPRSLRVCLHLHLPRVLLELSPKNVGCWPKLFRMLLGAIF